MPDMTELSLPIRPAQRGDAHVMAAIDASGQIHPWTEAQFARVCAGESPLGESALVWADGARVMGYVVFALALGEASVHRIAVHPEHRGRGIGQALLQSAMAHLQGMGASRCLLEVRRSNTVAQRLYAGSGFCVDGVRKNYYPAQGGREDALLMSREL